MLGRRGHRRYSVFSPPQATLWTSDNVLVQSATSDEVVVVSRHPGVLGELVTVDLQGQPIRTVRGRVAESQFVVGDGVATYRVRVQQ